MIALYNVTTLSQAREQFSLRYVDSGDLEELVRRQCRDTSYPFTRRSLDNLCIYIFVNMYAPSLETISSTSLRCE